METSLRDNIRREAGSLEIEDILEFIEEVRGENPCDITAPQWASWDEACNSMRNKVVTTDTECELTLKEVN